jgi:hypothetical protein
MVTFALLVKFRGNHFHVAEVESWGSELSCITVLVSTLTKAEVTIQRDAFVSLPAILHDSKTTS